MALIIQKFGGSSVADIERIQHVANIIARTKEQGHDVVAVVSAMFGETERLIHLAKAFPNSREREYAVLLATGEQVSAALLSMALDNLGCPSRSLTGVQAKIITTDDHKKARIIDIEHELLLAELKEGRVPVVTGFQGVSRKGQMTTLGRGGSDLTAVAIASALGADECQIYTDVDGVYTSDPKVVPDARRISRIAFTDMMELASQGAEVLQNRCLEYAGKFQVPVRVLSSMREGEGTLINYAKTDNETPMVSGVAFDRHQAQISLQRIPRRPGLISYLLSPIGQANIEIDMIVQNAPDRDGRIDFSFTLDRDDFSKAHEIAKQVVPELGAEAVWATDKVAKLSLVGVGLRSHATVASKLLSALGREGIEVLLLSVSEIKISVVIDEVYLELGVRVLHETFDLSDPSH